MTELLEVSYRRSLASNSSSNTNSGSNITKSVTSIFGWLGSSSSKPAEEKSSHMAVAGNSELNEKLAKFRIYLCPIKVRYAMLLADLGLVEEASKYVTDVLRLVKETGMTL